MPHGARQRSESGYYHVVSKGIQDQLLFGDDEDRRLYLALVAAAKEEFELRLHAYCLMSNHTHAVVEDERGLMGEAIKYVHERYATRYADRIERMGGVFRRNYWSEPIESDNRLLNTVRYIHNNPAAAGICRASQYEWSSVGDYLGRGGGLTDTDSVLELLGGRDGFIEFSRADSATAIPFEGSRLRGHLSDDEAMRVATAVLGHDPRLTSPDEVRLLKGRGFTHRQIARITGLGMGCIARA